MCPQLARICWGSSTGCFIYKFVIQVMWSVKKHYVAKILLAIWEMFLHENNRHYSSCIFSYKFEFIFFLSFLTNEKQEPGFQQVGGLETINISVFCLVALYFKAMPNSIDFYKGIFLHVIPVFFFVFVFSLSGFSFTNIHESQDGRGKWRAFL